MEGSKKELERYFPIADMLAKTFGDSCEVVIHDLSVPQSSVVYTVNNHVTGRQIGQPFEHLIRQVLLSKKFEREYAANYRTYDKNGKPIKSSTALLRGESGEVIGALCINLDSSMYQGVSDLLNQMLFVEPEDQPEEELLPDEHILDIVSNIIDNIIGASDVSALDRQERMDVISFMNSKGIFLVKGAIDQVAKKMGISKVTIYSYLDEVRHKQADGRA